VLEGVALGFAAVVGVFLLVVALERRLPHKKMLVATGLMITWVLIVLVGQTVQTLQKVGWVGVTPVEGLELPYWAGVWLGLYPTWQGLLAQAAALVFVIGSYLAAETLRKRRRARMVASLAAGTEGSGGGEGAADSGDGGLDVRVGVRGRHEPASERVAVSVDTALFERVAESGEPGRVLQRGDLAHGERLALGPGGDDRRHHRFGTAHLP
jgi:hypothetical protein